VLRLIAPGRQACSRMRAAIRTSTGSNGVLPGAPCELFDEDDGNLFEHIEDTVMRVAFEFSHRNRIQAARLLGISRNVLRARLIRAKEIAAMK
jgi:DNA-binding NtrC family response regulator